MSEQAHVLRLGQARKYGSYRDYKSGLYLTFPEKVEGTVPFGADLLAVYQSVKMKQLEDVNGTVVAEFEKARDAAKAQAAPTAAPPVIEAPAEVVEEPKTEEVKPAGKGKRK